MELKNARVPFNRADAPKCICLDCPVQLDSACVKDQAQKMGAVATTRNFVPDQIPLLYCASGIAACPDILGDRSCICGACEVYAGYHLGNQPPLDHFCVQGPAK